MNFSHVTALSVLSMSDMLPDVLPESLLGWHALLQS